MPLFSRRWVQPVQHRRLPFSQVAAPITGDASLVEGDDTTSIAGLVGQVGFYSPLLFVAGLSALPPITGTADIHEGKRVYGSAAIIEDA